jgi:hypothetical protein
MIDSRLALTRRGGWAFRSGLAERRAVPIAAEIRYFEGGRSGAPRAVESLLRHLGGSCCRRRLPHDGE